MQDRNDIIEQTKQYIKTFFEGNTDGHDYYHILRVYNTAVTIGEAEGANLLIVKMAALLHDIDDSKLVGENTSYAKAYLQQTDLTKEEQDHILYIIDNQSFKKSVGNVKKLHTIEAQVVQDADRLDSMGAIAIARTFAYGGKKGRAIYDPTIPIKKYTDEHSYSSSDSPSINHFYEKLLKLKDLMNTDAAKQIAEHRHQYMECFLEEFFQEWDAKK